MRFQLDTTGWSIGAVLIPAGTEINLDKPDAQLTEFEKLAKSHLPPPMNALALDDASEALMRRAYPWHGHLIRRATG